MVARNRRQVSRLSRQGLPCARALVAAVAVLVVARGVGWGQRVIRQEDNGMRFTCEIPEKASVGVPLEVTIEVRNVSGKPLRVVWPDPPWHGLGRIITYRSVRTDDGLRPPKWGPLDRLGEPFASVTMLDKTSPSDLRVLEAGEGFSAAFTVRPLLPGPGSIEMIWNHRLRHRTPDPRNPGREELVEDVWTGQFLVEEQIEVAEEMAPSIRERYDAIDAALRSPHFSPRVKAELFRDVQEDGHYHSVQFLLRWATKEDLDPDLESPLASAMVKSAQAGIGYPLVPILLDWLESPQRQHETKMIALDVIPVAMESRLVIGQHAVYKNPGPLQFTRAVTIGDQAVYEIPMPLRSRARDLVREMGSRLSLSKTLPESMLAGKACEVGRKLNVTFPWDPGSGPTFEPMDADPVEGPENDDWDGE